jgi:hypothetical protein
MEIIDKGWDEFVIRKGDAEITLTMEEKQELLNSIVEGSHQCSFWMAVDHPSQLGIAPCPHGHDTLLLKSPDKGGRSAIIGMTDEAEDELIRIIGAARGIPEIQFFDGFSVAEDKEDILLAPEMCDGSKTGNQCIRLSKQKAQILCNMLIPQIQ